ncbi:MAG: septum formation initiator family protein [bacterium]
MVAKLPKNAKRSFQAIFVLFFIGLLTTAILFFLLVSNSKLNQRKADLNSQIEFLAKEKQSLEKENQELKAGISQISQDSYLEKKAREQFNLKKPGEEVVAFIKDESEEDKKEIKENFWQKILNKLKF